MLNCHNQKILTAPIPINSNENCKREDILLGDGEDILLKEFHRKNLELELKEKGNYVKKT